MCIFSMFYFLQTYAEISPPITPKPFIISEFLAFFLVCFSNIGKLNTFQCLPSCHQKKQKQNFDLPLSSYISAEDFIHPNGLNIVYSIGINFRRCKLSRG